MATRVLGPTGSRRRRRFLFVSLLLVACGALFLAGAARAVHDEAFQLDGDALASTTTSIGGHTQSFDWDSFFNSAGAPSPVLPDASLPGFTASGFDVDFNTTNNGTTYDTSDATTFTQGSKDILNISSGWVCTPSNNVTNKGDIQNAYAVAYTNPVSGNQFLYFAQERNSNNGDANVGFWFLQDNASCPKGGGAWTGNHVDGDLFIVSAFTKGGNVSTITAFRWNGGANGSLGTTPVAGGGDCRAPNQALGDPICATANTTNITVPWLTDNNGSTTGLGHSLLTGEFFEGGINLTNTGLGNHCFNVFVGNTRSSQQLTATLFDFARGSLGECHSTTTTTPVDAANHANPPASTIPAAPADAQVNVQDQTVLTVTGINSFNGSIAWHLCGRTDPSSTQLCDGTAGNVGVDLGSTSITTAGTYFSPVVHVTAAGRYCFRAEFSGDNATGVPASSDSSASECFTVAPRTPTLTTTATPAVEIGTALDDTAHLGNTAKQPGTGGPAGASPAGSINPATLGGPAQGTITFTLYSASGANHCGTAIATRVVNVNGNGDYTASSGTGTGSLTPSATGTYFWRAVYSGDLPNTLGQNTPCDDQNESSVVVDAKISISPTQTNEVTKTHTFTVTLLKDTGDGNGFVAAAGEHVSFTLTNSNGANFVLDPVASTCDDVGPNTDASGQCTIVFTSATAGQVTGHASSNLTVGGVPLTRATTGTLHSAGDAVKTFVDAKISIAPDKTNEVTKPHTFTVTLLKDTGDGNGFVAAAGEHVSFTLTNSNGANFVLDPVASTCDDVGPNTDASGQCTIVFTSATAGQVTGHASSNLTVGGVPLTRATTGTLHSAGDAVKTFVDAKITITPPEATNTVGDPHTFTVTVQQDDGLSAAQGGDGVTGFGPAPNGTGVTVTLVNSDGAFFEIPIGGDTCAAIQFPPSGGTVNGVCTVTFTSQTAGTVTGNASVTFDVGGVSLTRDTNPATTDIPCGGDLVQGATCGPAVKHFLAGSIRWKKVDNANPPRLQGGATFALCRTATFNFTTKAFDPITPDCSFGPVVDNTGQVGYSGKDNDPVAGQFQVIGLPLGRYTVHETVAPPGYVPDPKTETVELSPNDPGPPPVNHTDQTITFPFVNSRPIVKITGLQYTNAPDTTVDQPDGIFVGDTTFTVALHNYGTADAVLTDSSLVVSNELPNTGLTCNNAVVPFTLPISQTIAAGASNSPAITLSCHYDHPDGKVIKGTLIVKYTTNVAGDTLTRTASGSPATISFTVNPN